jgi:CBS domain-containing protein
MFYVFGVQGRAYQGGVEQLQQVVPVTRTPRVRALHAAEIGVPSQVNASFGAPTGAIAQEAVHAYAQTSQQQPARQPLTRVEDVMSHDVVTVSRDSTAAQAWRVLAQHRISQAPVVNETGQLVGMLVRADMLPPEWLPSPDDVAAPLRKLLPQQRVSALMLTPVPSVDAATDLRRAARAMLERELPGLPVTNEAGRIEGFLSRSDVLKAVVADPPLDLWS